MGQPKAHVPKAASLKDLMIFAQKGDEKAYRSLLKKIQARLTPFVRVYIRSQACCEDVVQDTLLAIHTARHTYDGQRAFEPWMFAITRFKIADHLRKQGRRKDMELTPAEELDRVCGDAGVLPASLIEAAQGVITALPERQRQALIMLKFEGLSIKEAAKESGMTEAAVKVAAHRAYKALKSYFEL